MVVIPAGTFKMGNPSPEALDTAVPQHPVTIVRPFALGKYEVTFAEWDACFSEGSCAVFPNDSRWGRARRPVMNVSWSDAKLYIVWLQKKTGQAYRLPSEAEWEYAARARTTTPYSTGPSISTNQANYDGKQTLPVGSFAANAFGLHDMHGNVVEWVEDCFKVSYHGAPSDGRAWLEGDCSDRVVRGGSYNSINAWVRSYYRLSLPSETRRDDLGFRLARTLD